MAPHQGTLASGEVEYPTRLYDLAEPPMWLNVVGTIPQGPTAAIVGSRKADREGLRFAWELARGLAACGVTVVSGGARGIDQAAHKGALDGGGKTVIVLGCGLDVDYPKDSLPLRDKAAKNGAVLSELPDDAPPRPAHFPRRNRLVAALAQAVVVVQAGNKSGALSTASLAKKLGRPILAVPGKPGAPLTRGTHGLLRQGALLAEGVGDVMAAMGLKDPGEKGRGQPLTCELPGLPKEIFGKLKIGPQTADELSEALKKPVNEVLSALVELEMSELVINHGGCYEHAWRKPS